MWALFVAIFGISTGLFGLLAGAAALFFAGGNLSADFPPDAPELNFFGIGIPALAAGPVAYFLGRAAEPGPRRLARGAAILGVAATVIGAASGLLWLVIMLLGYFGPPPA